MIRVVLAITLTTALLGITLPNAERADRNQNADTATEDLEQTAADAARLVSKNNPVASSDAPTRRL